jgi:hypothetical protein
MQEQYNGIVPEESRYMQWNEEVREIRCEFGTRIAMGGGCGNGDIVLGLRELSRLWVRRRR